MSYGITEFVKSLGSKKRLRIDPVIIGLIVFNAMLFYVLFKYAKPFYETNDEFAMSAIATGFFGPSSPYIVFSNIIMGYMLQAMLKISPNFNWLVFSYYALMYMSYVVIGYVLMKKNKLWIGIGLYLTFIVTFFYGTLVHLNFTRVSTLGLVSGYVLFNHALNRSPVRSRLMATIGAFMVVFSSFIRSDSFQLVTAFVFVLLVLNTTQLIRKKDFAQLKWRSLRWGVLFSVVLITFGFNVIVSNQNPEIKKFIEYNTARAKVTDFALPDWKTNEAYFTELGISENDLTTIKYWVLADPEKITVEFYNAISSASKPVTLKQFAYKTYVAVGSIFRFLVFPIIVSCYIGLRSLKRNRYRILVHLGLYSVFAAEILYLVFIGRPIIRALFSVTLTLGILIITTFEVEKVGKKAILTICALLMAFGFSTYAFRHDYLQIKAHDDTVIRRDTLMDALNATGNIYVWQTIKINMVFGGYTLFESPHKGAFANSLSIGGWTTEVPMLNEKLKAMGITNVIKSLITDPRVYYIGENDGSMDVLLTYLRENYNATTYVRKVDEIEGVSIFKFKVRKR